MIDNRRVIVLVDINVKELEDNIHVEDIKALVRHQVIVLAFLRNRKGVLNRYIISLQTELQEANLCQVKGVNARHILLNRNIKDAADLECLRRSQDRGKNTCNLLVSNSLSRRELNKLM